MASPSPDADLALLIEAARLGGAAAMRFFRAEPKRWDKEAGAGPVTEADLAADAAIRAHLARARPGWGWLSEESEDDKARLACDAVAILDPIDGTRAFIAGEPGWCVALALVAGGEPVAGVALFPALDRLYSARRGGGAFRDGAAIRAAARRDLDGAQALGGRAVLDPKHWRGDPPPLRRVFRPAMIHRLCLVAEGAADATLSFAPVWEWDLAAGAVIAAEAGATVTDAQAAPFRFNADHPRHDGLIAANPALHAALRARR